MDAARRRGGARGGAGAGAGAEAYDQLVDALEEHRHEEVRELRDRADRADRAGAGAGAGPGGDLRLVGKGGPEDVKVRGLRPPRSPPHASVYSPQPTPRPKPLPGFPPRRERTPELATAGQSAVGRSRGASHADDRTPGRPRPIHLRGSARPRLDAAAEEEHGPRTTD